MKIYLVRHGETNYNVLHLNNCEPSSSKVYLTNLGKRQAKQAAKKLEDIRFDLIFTSELPRTQETAKIITKKPISNFIIDNRLNDRRTGLEDKSVEEFNELIANDVFSYKPPGGESFQEEKKRVISFLKELGTLEHDNILILAHCETIQIANGYYKKYSDQEMWDTEVLNCQIIEIII